LSEDLKPGEGEAFLWRIIGQAPKIYYLERDMVKNKKDELRSIKSLPTRKGIPSKIQIPPKDMSIIAYSIIYTIIIVLIFFIYPKIPLFFSLIRFINIMLIQSAIFNLLYAFSKTGATFEVVGFWLGLPGWIIGLILSLLSMRMIFVLLFVAALVFGILLNSTKIKYMTPTDRPLNGIGQLLWGIYLLMIPIFFIFAINGIILIFIGVVRIATAKSKVAIPTSEKLSLSISQSTQEAVEKPIEAPIKELTIPIKLIIKGNNLVNVARRPATRENYKFILSLGDKAQWLPLIGRPFFQCPVCGTMNDENWDIINKPGSLMYAKRLKIVTGCKNCRTKYVKVVSKVLWGDLLNAIKKPKVKPRIAPLTPSQKIENILLHTAKFKVLSRFALNLISTQSKVPINEVEAIAQNLILEGKLISIEEPETPPSPELISEETELASPTPKTLTEEIITPSMPIGDKAASTLPKPIMDEAELLTLEELNIEEAAPPVSEPYIEEEAPTASEEIAPSISEPYIKELVPPTPKLSIMEAKPPAPKPLIERIAYRAPELKCPSCGGPTTKYQELCKECMREREREIVQSPFICKKCGNPQLAIQKMKMNNLLQIITNSKCPKCEKSTQFILDPLKIGDWIELLTPSFFKCGKCGSACKIVKTTSKANTMQVTLYCEIDWIDIQKEIPVSLFQTVMTQIQKV